MVFALYCGAAITDIGPEHDFHGIALHQSFFHLFVTLQLEIQCLLSSYLWLSLSCCKTQKWFIIQNTLMSTVERARSYEIWWILNFGKIGILHCICLNLHLHWGGSNFNRWLIDCSHVLFCGKFSPFRAIIFFQKNLLCQIFLFLKIKILINHYVSTHSSSK